MQDLNKMLAKCVPESLKWLIGQIFWNIRFRLGLFSPIQVSCLFSFLKIQTSLPQFDCKWYKIVHSVCYCIFEPIFVVARSGITFIFLPSIFSLLIWNLAISTISHFVPIPKSSNKTDFALWATYPYVCWVAYPWAGDSLLRILH